MYENTKLAIMPKFSILCICENLELGLGSSGSQPKECDNLCQVVLYLPCDDWWMSTIIKSLSQHPCLSCVAYILTLGSQLPPFSPWWITNQWPNVWIDTMKLLSPPGQEISCSSVNHARSSKSNVGDNEKIFFHLHKAFLHGMFSQYTTWFNVQEIAEE